MSSPSSDLIFYLVRHGESTGNRAGVLQGQSDYPLTDVGRQQAKATGRRLLAEWHSIQSAKNSEEEEATGAEGDNEEEDDDDFLFFHHVFSSDLSRAKETMELILEELRRSEEPSSLSTTLLHPPPRFDLDLREISAGVRENKKLGTRPREAIAMAAAEAGIPLDSFIPPSYETMTDLVRRANQFIDRVVEEVDEVRRGKKEKTSSSSSSSSLPHRVLVVSHGGLMLQMFQKVFAFHSVDRVLNASLTIVEARIKNGATRYKAHVINDVRHLEEEDIITTKSTAL